MTDNNNKSAIEVYTEMRQVNFEKRPVTVLLNGENKETNNFAIVKTGGFEKIVGMTKEKYNILQPADYCLAFDESVGQPVDNIGFLGNMSPKMFITWNLPEIDIRGDEVKLWGFLVAGFDGRYGEHLYITSKRMYCSNQYNIAISDANKTNNHGRGSLFSGKHNTTTHLGDLKSWMQYIQEDAEKNVEIIRNLFLRLYDIPVSDDLAKDLFAKVYPIPDPMPAFYPSDLREKKEKFIEEKTEKAKEDQDLAFQLFNGAGKGIEKNGWGWYNSVTEKENHWTPSKKEDTYSILLGNKHNIMNKALDIISNY